MRRIPKTRARALTQGDEYVITSRLAEVLRMHRITGYELRPKKFGMRLGLFRPYPMIVGQHVREESSLRKPSHTVGRASTSAASIESQRARGKVSQRPRVEVSIWECLHKHRTSKAGCAVEIRQGASCTPQRSGAVATARPLALVR